MRLAAIVVAGGSGERFGNQGGKQLLPLAGRPMLSWTLLAVDSCPEVDRIVVVTHPDRVDEYRRAALDSLTLRSEVRVVAGGARRQDSVAAGLANVPDDYDLIAVHDGARPLASGTLFTAAAAALAEDAALDGAVIGHPVTDTLKVVDGVRVTGTAPRSQFWAVQTPQVFRARTLRRAYEEAAREGWEATDDAGLVERAGGAVRMVEGPRDNVKVTVPEDAALAEAMLLRGASGGEGRSMTRIGFGFDVHAFAEGRPLVLGGVTIPYERGLAGHSDADVLAHALADAILGAMRAGDIGKHFPDTDAEWAGADSLNLLGKVAALMRDEGWELADADCVVVAEAPKLAPYRDKMQANLAECLGVSDDAVGVKATTTEGLGFTGRGEGIAAYATVLLERAVGHSAD